MTFQVTCVEQLSQTCDVFVAQWQQFQIILVDRYKHVYFAQNLDNRHPQKTCHSCCLSSSVCGKDRDKCNDDKDSSNLIKPPMPIFQLHQELFQSSRSQVGKMLSSSLKNGCQIAKPTPRSAITATTYNNNNHLFPSDSLSTLYGIL